MTAAKRILICDLVGLARNGAGEPDVSEVKAHIEAKGGVFHHGLWREGEALAEGRLHFFHAPDLACAADFIAAAGRGQYDAVIAAATIVPEACPFPEGGVRMGAGTGNMHSRSWGGPNGSGGAAPLMNTPGFNARATAQMVMRALLHFLPDLPLALLHGRVMAGTFDTSRHLKDFPTHGLAGRRIAIAGFGNIGSAVAHLARAFGMVPVIYSRPHHREKIERAGFLSARSIEAAATAADVVTLHAGLGQRAADGSYENAGMLDAGTFTRMNRAATVINFDRGECLNVTDLQAALAAGQVAHAAIDADIFVDEKTGAISGPLAPYLPLAREFPGRVLLLPHAAADTDHPTRVAAAKQAVDQTIAAITTRTVHNLKGDLPKGYADGGAVLPPWASG
jgi:lactate dehydrogenase-like 2-hydroxyacid dehydrogenase